MILPGCDHSQFALRFIASDLRHCIASCSTPFPQIDIIGAMVIVWRVRGKIIRSVLCSTIMHSAMHTHMNGPNSSLEWVLSHWAHFTVLRFMFVCLYMYYCMHVYYCNMVRWTWWDWSLSLGLLLPAVAVPVAVRRVAHWHCLLGHLNCKNLSLIWPLMCLVGR